MVRILPKSQKHSFKILNVIVYRINSKCSQKEVKREGAVPNFLHMLHTFARTEYCTHYDVRTTQECVRYLDKSL